MRVGAVKLGVMLLALVSFAPPAEGLPVRPRAKPKRPRKMPSMRSVPAPVAPEVSPAPDLRPTETRPFLWRQVFAAPSIGDRVLTFTVDPRDARRIFVGTEQGRILRTTDGGGTWVEIDPQPFLIKDRSRSFAGPSRPDLNDVDEGNFDYWVLPPEWWGIFVLAPDDGVEPFAVHPDAFYARLRLWRSGMDEPLLGSIATARGPESVSIRFIAICPGARYEVFVATESELLGSSDGGLSFVRLFANPGGHGLTRVACSDTHPELVALTTDVGLFISKNGGLTFNPDLTAWPGQPATLVHFGPDTPEGRPRLYSTSDSDLYAGDPDDPKGLSVLYPGSDPNTAPWLPINELAVEDQDIWLATDDGVRRSRDGGQSFETVARMLFAQQSAVNVSLGENEAGARRVAVMVNHTPATMDGVPVSALHDSIVYASDDDGRSWVPFFYGLSRRTFRRMAYVPAEGDRPGSWWLATSGEIWTTAPFVAPVADPERADVAWAKEALLRTPPMDQVIARALEAMQLDNQALMELAERRRLAPWLPRIDAQFTWKEPQATAAITSDSIFDPELSYTEQATGLARGGSFMVQATWELYDTKLFSEEVEPTRTRLHELRKQMAYVVEDAWHERVVHLQLMAEGLSDPLQVLTLKSRVEALDALLAVWTDQGRKEQ